MADKKNNTSTARPEIVQWYDKETDRYVKFERATATVISVKVTAGPYKNIHTAKRRPVVRKRKVTPKKKVVAPKKKVTKKKVVKKKAPPKPRKPKNYLNNRDLLAQVMISKEAGKMSDILAHMLTLLCARYGRRGNFANYTYNEDMQAYAMMMLVRTWNSFNPEKSNNPFAFFTQCIKNSFIQYLNHEKRHRVIRDEIMVDKGLNPSYTYQLEHEAKQEEAKKAKLEEAKKPTSEAKIIEY